MDKIALTAQVREKVGKGAARGLRRDAQVPAVLYSHGKSTPIVMVNKDVSKVLNTEGGAHALINLKLEGGKGVGDKLALIKDYQVDPISGRLIHLDLMEVAMNEKVKIQVAVHISGNSIGVKEGGIFQYGQRDLEIECLPAHIPDFIDVNIGHLKVNESLHVRDIKAPEGVKILTELDATVVRMGRDGVTPYTEKAGFCVNLRGRAVLDLLRQGRRRVLFLDADSIIRRDYQDNDVG